MKTFRLKSVITLCAALAFASGAIAQDAGKKIAGFWKFDSIYSEIKTTGEKRKNFGEKPRGYLYFSPGGRLLSFYTAQERPKPATDADRAAAMRTMYAINGTYSVKGNQYTVKVDSAWDENQVGGEVKRDFKIEGNKMTIVTQWGPSPFLAGNPEARSVVTLSRAK
jgi:hypothetical protein